VPLIGAANRPASPPPPGSFRRRLAQTADRRPSPPRRAPTAPRWAAKSQNLLYILRECG
jgi:hypothetical protein